MVDRESCGLESEGIEGGGYCGVVRRHAEG